MAVFGIVPLSDKCRDNEVRAGFADVGGGNVVLILLLLVAALGSLDHMPPLDGKLDENRLVEGLPAPKLLERLVPPLSYNLLPSLGDPVPIGSGKP